MPGAGTKVLVVGAGGQLGGEVCGTAPAGVEVVAADRAALDITDRHQVARTIGEARPGWIVNCAAYTAVDRAEQEVEAASRLNAAAPGHLAAAAADAGARLLHVSTDFVFSGTGGRPYRPDDETGPASVYGRTKLEGERAVREALGDRALVVRTAWLYTARGGNFVRTMLRLMGEREEVGVVADQIGTPTWARGLADALWRMIARDLEGTHHWTDAGVASWYDFAVAIREEALELGLLDRPARVTPLTTAQFPTPAARPPFSVLDKTATWAALGGPASHWRTSLRSMLAELAGMSAGAAEAHAPRAR